MQKNYALTLDKSKKQWADMGIHTKACITRPETCGAAGGAISVWIKIVDCLNQYGGVISSYRPQRSNFFIRCGSMG